MEIALRTSLSTDDCCCGEKYHYQIVPMPHRRRYPVPKSLLILRCDTERLREQGLAMDDDVVRAAAVARLGVGAQVEIINGTDRSSVLKEFGALAQRRCTFDVIVVVGHGNPSGIQLASDAFVFWRELPDYLRLFHPRRLILIACQAGAEPAPELLFAALPRLQRIYASGLNVSVNLARFLLLVLPYVLAARAPTRQYVAIGKILALTFTGGALREWRRNGITREEMKFDGVVEILAQVLG